MMDEYNGSGKIMRLVKRTGRKFPVYSGELILQDATPAEIPPEIDGWYRVIVIEADISAARAAAGQRYNQKIGVLRRKEESKDTAEAEKQDLCEQIEELQRSRDEEIARIYETYSSDTYLYKDGIWYTGSEDNNERAIQAAQRYTAEIKKAKYRPTKERLRRARDERIKNILTRSSAKPIIAYGRQPLHEYWNNRIEDEQRAVQLIGKIISDTMNDYKAALRTGDGKKIAAAERNARKTLAYYSTGVDPEQAIDQYRKEYGYGSRAEKQYLKLRSRQRPVVNLDAIKARIAIEDGKPKTPRTAVDEIQIFK